MLNGLETGRRVVAHTLAGYGYVQGLQIHGQDEPNDVIGLRFWTGSRWVSAVLNLNGVFLPTISD